MIEPIFEIKQNEKKGNKATFVISPLEAGYGNTLGTALRRVALTSLPGAAPTSVRISGVKHRFTTLKGMKEDIVEFILNLKKVRVAYKGDGATISLSAKGPGEVTAGDLETPANITIANPELVLANLAKGATLNAKIEVSAGSGYRPINEEGTSQVGVIPLDAVFSPVLKVNYKIEETRVGRLTNYDKLTLEIETDGTISPKDALLDSTKILMAYLNQVISPKKVAKVKSLVKVRNLGEKSIKIIAAALGEKGVEF